MKTILKKVYQSNVQMLSDTLVLADDENYEKEKFIFRRCIDVCNDLQHNSPYILPR